MRWMPKQSQMEDSGVDLNFLSLDSDLFKQVSRRFEKADISFENFEGEISPESTEHSSMKVLGLPVSKTNFKEQTELLESLLKNDETLSIIILDEGLDPEELIALGENSRVFAIVEIANLSEELIKGSRENQKRISSQPGDGILTQENSVDI